MSEVLLHRKRIARRLLVLEAGLLTGVLAVFALISWWLAGARSSGVVVAVGLVLMGVLLGADWQLVRGHWRRLRDDYGGGRGR